MDNKLENWCKTWGSISSLINKIEDKQKEIDNATNEINALESELNNACKEVIFSKFKEGQFLTHRGKYVFKLGTPYETIRNCKVIVYAFADIEHKSFCFDGIPLPVCRATSLIANARPSTKEEIDDYYICRRMSQCKALGV